MTAPPPPPTTPAPPPPGAEATWGRSGGAGRRIDDGAGRVFPCGSCGADLEFSIDAQALACPYCGAEQTIELDDEAEIRERDFAAELQRQAALRQERQQRAADEAGGGGDPAHGAATQSDALNEVRCESCGANVAFPGTLTSTECAFCGAPVQREDAHTAEDRVPVDGMLPFVVDADRAKTNLAAWVKSLWFAPNAFKERGVKGRFNGVYLPFWTYDSHTYTRWSGQRGEHYYVTVGSGKNKRRERRTRWYPVSGTFRRFFDDVLVVAAHGMHRELIHELEPWPLDRAVPFTQEMLAGFLAQTYDLPLEQGFVEARQRIDAALREDVRRRIGGDAQRISSVASTYEPITYKHLLLPVWLLGYRWKDRSYQVVVNAVTGEVRGERPWSWLKITLAVLAGLVVVGGGFLAFQASQGM